jgi:ribose transport system ATP-binding protein
MTSAMKHGSAVAGTEAPVLEMRGICKSFGAIKVLEGVDLTCRRGTVTAICGENGAGKSTLINVLGGVFQPTAGEILIEGRPVSFSHPAQAKEHRIAIIHQELNLLPYRSVADNIFLGREQTRFGFIDRTRMNREAGAVLSRLGSAIDPNAACGKLSIAEQQLVEIARAISEDARILVLDEPTATLNDAETHALFRLIDELRRRGVTLLYISHRMAELRALADTIVIIKDGRQVATRAMAEIEVDEVVRLMVGRALEDFFPPPASAPPGAALYSVTDGAAAGKLAGISLTLHAGEIVGVAGLEGSGKAELARAMAGVEPFSEGTIRLFDGGGAPQSPRAAARRGIGTIPEDRKGEGLGLAQSLRDNCALTMRALAPSLGRANGAGRSRKRIDALLDGVAVKAADYAMPVGQLSGGNQQKVMFARSSGTAPKVWIVAEPTRGIDVGARAAIYAMLRGFAEAGAAVMVISSDLMEIIGLSDRILVMAAGRLVAELPRGASEEEIIRHAMGYGRPEVVA